MEKSKIKNQISKLNIEIKNFAFCFVILIFAFYILHFMVGCSKEIPKEEILKVPVRVMEVKVKTLKNTLDYVGDIKAQEEVLVYPKVSGKIIEKIKQEGDGVAKGEPIAYVDRDEVGFKFEKAPVESPLTGVVGKVYVDMGTSVTTQTQVAMVVNMDSVQINLEIPQKYLSKIYLGQLAQVSVDAFAEVNFTGTVTKISPVLNLETRAAPIEITIANNDHRLRSGMFAKVKLIIEEFKDVPVVFKEAIIGRGDDAYVYVIEDNKAVLRKISLGISEDVYYQAKEGLQEGNLVVIMGQQRLRDGIEVEVEEIEK